MVHLHLKKSNHLFLESWHSRMESYQGERVPRTALLLASTLNVLVSCVCTMSLCSIFVTSLRVYIVAALCY